MGSMKRLAIFDMDGTLILSPGPRPGEDRKRHWKDPEPLATREAPPILSTVEAFHRARAEGATVLVMTGRRHSPEMQEAARVALERAGVEGFARLILKPQSEGDTGEWKERMILELAEEHGASRVDLWDDRPEHATAFRAVLEGAGLEGRVTDVDDPRWLWSGRRGEAMPKDS